MSTLNFSIGILSWQGYDSLVNSLISYQKNGLSLLTNQKFICLPEYTKEGLKIAKKFKIKAIPIKSALNASNKILMKKKFKKFKINTPKFYIIKNFTEFRKRIKKFNQNIIIKPSDNCGSRGVFLLNKNYNYKKLKYYFEKSLKLDPNKKKLLKSMLIHYLKLMIIKKL